MKALAFGTQPTIIQREILLDISELAFLIEEEFGNAFKPYTAGWYHQLDLDEPCMPDMSPLGLQVYHTKGGEVLAPWGEKVTIITDPNTAAGSIYDQDGEMAVELRSLGMISMKYPYSPRNIFTRRPRFPVRGAEVVREYVSWIIDHSCEWQQLDTPFDQYAQHFLDKTQIEAAEVMQIDRSTQNPNLHKLPLGTISEDDLPYVEHRNILFEQLKERLQFYSAPLRLTLDAFMGASTWDTYSVAFRGMHSLHIRKLGDYRILEWERLKQEGKI